MIREQSKRAPEARGRDNATKWRVGPCEQEGAPDELCSSGGGRSPPSKMLTDRTR